MWQIETLQKRRCSPLLEHELLYNCVLLGSSEWTAVPDIWRTAAEKYGDQTALVDPYHEPSLKLTYKEVNFLHQNFCFFIIFGALFCVFFFY